MRYNSFMADVLKLLQCTNLGGMEQSVYRLMPLLQERGWEFRVESPRPMGPGEPFLQRVDPAARGHSYRGRFGWRSQKAFAQDVASRAAGATCAWITGTDVACLRVVQGLDCRKLLGHHYHHFDSLRSVARWWLFYHGLCRQLDAVTFPGDYTRNEALRIAPWLRNRAHIVHYAFDAVYTDEAERERRRIAARKRLNLPQDAWICGNAGWLIPRKRFDVFLDTARFVADAIGPRAFFVICGSGPLEHDLRLQAARLGIAERVHFAGWQTDVFPWYDAMDALLFSSDFDAFCLTPCESSARGTPVVASLGQGGLGELIRDGVDGYLANRHDPAILAANVKRLHDNPQLAADMRASVADRLRKQHNWEQALDFYDTYFRGGA